MQESRFSTGFKSSKNPTYFVCFCCKNWGKLEKNFELLFFVFSKFKAASGAVSHQHIVRPRSINGLADQGAAALTDGQYIERLQLALQQASVSSLQERLAERKVQSVMQLPVGIIFYSRSIDFRFSFSLKKKTVNSQLAALSGRKRRLMSNHQPKRGDTFRRAKCLIGRNISSTS